MCLKYETEATEKEIIGYVVVQKTGDGKYQSIFTGRRPCHIGVRLKATNNTHINVLFQLKNPGFHGFPSLENTKMYLHDTIKGGATKERFGDEMNLVICKAKFEKLLALGITDAHAGDLPAFRAKHRTLLEEVE